MARILVTGGTGTSGTAIVNRLKQTKHQVRLLSRKPAPADADPVLEWAQGDIVTGEGLAAALTNVDVVVNCTGNPQNTYETDVLGVQRLAEASASAGVKNFVHVSIVGCDLMDFAYYQHKVSAEKAVIASGVPYSIQRISQFYTLVNFFMTKITETDAGYVLPMAGDALFQGIDVRDVADYLVPIVAQPAGGMLPDLAGPEVLNVETLARQYLAVRGIHNPTLLNPATPAVFTPEAVSDLQQGKNTAPAHAYKGGITWAQYLDERQAQRQQKLGNAS